MPHAKEQSGFQARRNSVAIRKKQKKAYVAPHVVDFGAIDEMTGDCFGFCEDGVNGGYFGLFP